MPSNFHGNLSHFGGQGVVNERWGHIHGKYMDCTGRIRFVFFQSPKAFCSYFKLNLVMLLSNMNGDGALWGLSFTGVLLFVNIILFLIKMFAEG